MMIGLSLTTAFTVVFLFTVFAPSLCRKNSAFYTTVVGLIGIGFMAICTSDTCIATCNLF